MKLVKTFLGGLTVLFCLIANGVLALCSYMQGYYKGQVASYLSNPEMIAQLYEKKRYWAGISETAPGVFFDLCRFFLYLYIVSVVLEWTIRGIQKLCRNEQKQRQCKLLQRMPVFGKKHQRMLPVLKVIFMILSVLSSLLILIDILAFGRIYIPDILFLLIPLFVLSDIISFEREIKKLDQHTNQAE